MPPGALDTASSQARPRTVPRAPRLGGVTGAGRGTVLAAGGRRAGGRCGGRADARPPGSPDDASAAGGGGAGGQGAGVRSPAGAVDAATPDAAGRAVPPRPRPAGAFRARSDPRANRGWAARGRRPRAEFGRPVVATPEPAARARARIAGGVTVREAPAGVMGGTSGLSAAVVAADFRIDRRRRLLGRDVAGRPVAIVDPSSTPPSRHGIAVIGSGKRGGRPVIRGLRIDAGDVADWLAPGMIHAEGLEDLTDLTEADIRAVPANAAERERATVGAAE